MDKKKWTMQENFIFPTEAGMPAEAVSLRVTPGFMEERTEQAVRLSGIYHIAAEILFTEEGPAGELEEPDTAVLIEDVEMDGNRGYFEYAVPLHIDLPAEAKSPIHVTAMRERSEEDGQGSISIVWDVECEFNEAVAEAVESSSFRQFAETVETPEVVHLTEEEEPVPSPVVLEEEVQEEEAVAEEPVAQEETATAMAESMNDSTSYQGSDEALSFIAGLKDEYSTTLFRLNDIFIKQKG
ncbi:hypothetical protein OXB_3135 [Bacillus sp. OxB-1]|uniref:hypothetical protein n=1 Tax=Bacillus sp. (strain OxB-1) TaxID=98228 RepID=UPI0005822E3A|nr:hypothetical protein [Bacillus sp. OxB-1]BAQ11604.1 hypothetical protein OXB_3135 [Bacillus sp. OxB-1]